MRALVGFAVAGGLAVSLCAWVATALLAPEVAESVWWAAALAYGVQVVAFAALVAVRGRGLVMWAVWGSGMLLRFGLIMVAGLWLVRAAALDPAVLLLGLAGFLFLLLLLEPVFFRVGSR